MKQTEIDGVADTLIPDDWEVCLKKDCHGPWHCKAGERITWLTY